MSYAKFLARWEGLVAENRFSRVLICALLILSLLLAVRLFQKDTLVVLQPATLSEEAWVTQNKASQSYQEAWGLFLAELLGNVTPATGDFIQARLKPLLAPGIYHETMQALDTQIQQIRDHRVVLRFEPRTVDYEPATGKVFVYGHAFEQGASTQSARKLERTYEYQIEIAHYAPLIRHLNVYAGKPRTEKVLEALQRQQAEKQKREREK